MAGFNRTVEVSRVPRIRLHDPSGKGVAVTALGDTVTLHIICGNSMIAGAIATELAAMLFNGALQLEVSRDQAAAVPGALSK